VLKKDVSAFAAATGHNIAEQEIVLMTAANENSLLSSPNNSQMSAASSRAGFKCAAALGRIIIGTNSTAIFL